MTARRLLLALALGAGVSACTTGGGLPPAQVVRYHLDQPIMRGTIAVQPLDVAASNSLSFAPYAAAVREQLLRLGYTVAPAGALPDYIALTEASQEEQVGPPRRSPISIGLGAGGYSGGGWNGGGVGLGGGVGFPIGGGGRRALIAAQLSVTIKRRADQSAVWEGHARSLSDARSPAATTQAIATRLATALFTGFPGESGRTIEVR